MHMHHGTPHDDVHVYSITITHSLAGVFGLCCGVRRLFCAWLAPLFLLRCRGSLRTSGAPVTRGMVGEAAVELVQVVRVGTVEQLGSIPKLRPCLPTPASRGARPAGGARQC